MEEESSQESALLNTFYKHGTVWKSEFDHVEKIENECVIVTPGFPNNAVQVVWYSGVGLFIFFLVIGKISPVV